jgi:lincosamide nucleotidyltransferase
MASKEMLLQRLDEIGEMLGTKGGVLALMGVGSVGVETDRIDEYSDLDFFVIVSPGYKQRFIDQLDWLEAVHPLAYHFKNSDAGHKILFQDGIYGEFAVFDEKELKTAGYAGARIVWRDPAFDREEIPQSNGTLPRLKADSVDYAIGEAVTNLYVGLGRYHRGERFTASLFVHSYALGQLIKVLHVVEPEVDYFPDPFGIERRLERRYPEFAKQIGQMLQGYDRVPESAIAILNFLEEHFPINHRMSAEIRRLAAQSRS